MKNKLTTKFLMSMFTWQTVAEKIRAIEKVLLIQDSFFVIPEYKLLNISLLSNPLKH